MLFIIQLLSYPTLLTVVIFALIFIGSFALYIYTLEGEIDSTPIAIVSMLVSLPTFLVSLIGLVFTAASLFIPGFVAKSDVEETTANVATFESLHERKLGKDVELSVIEKDSIFTNYFTVVWQTSLQEVNAEDKVKEFKTEYEKFCTFHNIDCHVSIKEEKDANFSLDAFHLQLNDEYTISKDADKKELEDYKTLPYPKQTGDKGSLFIDLDDSGFEVKYYGYYNLGYYTLDEVDENYVTLILERPLEEADYKRLMSIFAKWIDKYPISLKLENKSGITTDVINYKDLKAEVENL